MVVQLRRETATTPYSICELNHDLWEIYHKVLRGENFT